MRHGDDRAGVLGQMPFEPGDALGVKMVRRFVEQQQVGLFEQHLAQRDAAPLAAGELRHVGIARRQVHRVHGDFDLPVEFPGVVQLRSGPAPWPARFEQLFHLVGVVIGSPSLSLISSKRSSSARVSADGFFDVAQHVLVGIELRLLRAGSRR